MSLSKLAILGVLMEKPMHGYELKRYFDTRMGVFWMINYGSIYPTLKKLEGQGLVISRREPSDTVDRKVYEITKKGREEFIELLRRRIKKDIHVRDEFTLHLFFLDYLDKEEIKSLLTEKLEGNKRLLEHLTEKNKTLRSVLPRYRFSTIERGIAHVKTELEWLSGILKEAG